MNTKGIVLGLGIFGSAVQSFGGEATNSCKELYATSRNFTSLNALQFPRPFDKREFPRSQYEKTADFNIRLKNEEATARKKAEDAAASLSKPTGWFKFQHDYSPYDIKYDADKEKLTMNTILMFGMRTDPALPAGILHGFTVDETKGRTEFKPYGIKEKSSSSLGFYYRTKLSNNYLHDRGKGLTIKMSPKSAVAIGGNISLVVVGKLAPPYVLSYYSSSDDLAQKTISSRHSTSAVIEMHCAAIINRATGELLLELK